MFFPLKLTLTVNDEIEYARLHALLFPTLPVVSKDAAAQVEKPAAQTARGQRTAEVAVAAAPAKTADASAQSAASAEAAPQASTAVADVAYTDLQKVILKLHGKDPNATQAIAKSMGLENFKPLKDDATSERRAKALGLINAKLAELEG